MTIEKIDVNVCSPGRNFVTLKIVTGDGVIGWEMRRSTAANCRLPPICQSTLRPR